MTEQDKINILVIDRNAAYLKLIGEYVRKSGFAVTTVATPAEAVEVFEKAPDRFALLITGLIMPETDGWTLAQELRKIRPELQVIFTSVEPLDEIVRVRRLPISSEAWLKKPFGQKALHDKMLLVMTGE